jgi:hypothetical protein
MLSPESLTSAPIVMEKQQALETELSYPSTEEPHFDEEWTVLAARQVVPLTELNSRSYRALKLVAAFLIASLLGAVVALSAIRLRETPVSQVNTDAFAEQNDANRGQTVTNQPIDNQSAQNDTTVAADQSYPSPVARTKTPLSLIERAKNRSPQMEKVESSDPTEQAESVRRNTHAPSVGETSDSRPTLVDQWQEKRARRAIRRYRRERPTSHSRDLRRIDEIFEGVRPE